MTAPKTRPDDWFAAGRARLSHGEALALLEHRIIPVVGEEAVPLGEIAGRVLAAGVIAAQPIPLHTNSAVDGYAFRAPADRVGSELRLTVEGRSAAGRPMAEPADPVKAARILTGAVMPAAYDTVVMQEDVSLETVRGTSIVAIPPGLKRGANVRPAGEDVAAGSELYGPGHIVRPQDVAALAAMGQGSARCFRRLRVGVLSTGDEVVRPGTGPLLMGQVYDANAPMLLALARLAGAEVVDLGVLPDDAATVRASLADAARRFDAVLTSGGASQGEEDHLAAALAELGHRHLWQLAIKPGRPIAFGQIGSCVVVGLPGNPVAVFVCALMYVFPMLRRLGGAPWRTPRRLMLPAAFAFAGRKKGRREFWRGMLVDRDGNLTVDKFDRDGSGLITSLRVADGLIDVPEDAGDVAAGDPVAFIPFTEFGIA